jgi:hypothetical protein
MVVKMVSRNAVATSANSAPPPSWRLSLSVPLTRRVIPVPAQWKPRFSPTAANASGGAAAER